MLPGNVELSKLKLSYAIIKTNGVFNLALFKRIGILH
jgi:hypothetical protein